jgi:hypothetical protein
LITHHGSLLSADKIRPADNAIYVGRPREDVSGLTQHGTGARRRAGSCAAGDRLHIPAHAGTATP